MKTKLTRILALALSLMLLAGTSAAAANGPHTDSDMGGVGGAAGSIEGADFDPADHEPAGSIGEWLDQWNGPIDIDIDLLRGVPGLVPTGTPGEPQPNPGPTGGDEQTECEKNPDSIQCKGEQCDAIEPELDEGHDNWYELSEEEQDELREKRDWYRDNCLGTP